MPAPLSSWSDEDLAAEARVGSSACFEVLVGRYQVRLIRFVLRSLSQQDAEDVVQDTFVQAYLNLSRFDPKYRFKTWLFVIAQRLMIDRLRKRRPALDVHEIDIAHHNDPHDRAASAERASALWTVAKQELSDEAYRAMWLHYVEEMGTLEVAKVLKRSWVWVKTTLHRSRRKLAPHVRSLSDHSSDRRLGFGPPPTSSDVVG
jgi:RNA polymerase sigma-70 factor, ECF subfamily